MSLIFRLAWVLLASLRGPRLGALDESLVRLRVLPNDLDANLHLNNGRYLTLMDLGRVDLLLRMGLVAATRRNRWSGVVASATVRFNRPLNLFQRFEMRSRLLGWDQRWFFLEQRFTREDDQVAFALVKVQFRGREGRVAPQEVVDAFAPGVAPPPLPPAVREWQDAERALVEAGWKPAPAVA